MARGVSLHIGVNDVDPDHYYGWNEPLLVCHNDADVMSRIARENGFEAHVLKSAEATRGAVCEFIVERAAELQSGDIFLLSFAGHGGQCKDVDGDEEDLVDETWCLYDGQLLDDELNILWSHFAPGVRLLILSDSCHSGTVAKDPNAMGQRQNLLQAGPTGGETRYRCLSRKAALATFRANRDFYTTLQFELPRPHPPVKASVRLLSGCQDDQLSSENDENGRFTRTLAAIWGEGFDGSYDELHREMRGRMPPEQQPNHLQLGERDEGFDRQRPFTI